jgi:3-hydroxybutyryl-CoA dehydratase
MSYVAHHLFFDDVPLEHEWRSPGRTITEADVVNFAGMSGDFSPIHVDHEFAKSTPYHRPMAHGLLVFSVGSGLGLSAPPVRTMALMEVRQWTFKGPVFIGDTIHVRSKAVNKEVRGRGRRGVITWQRQIVNQEGKVVQEGMTVTMVQGRAGDPDAGGESNEPAAPEI